MPNETVPARIRWPRAIFKLTAKDFVHGSWSYNPDADDEYGVSGTSPTVCGTRCCAVGWVATAFGESPVPDGIEWDPKKEEEIYTGRGWARDRNSGRDLYPEGSPVHTFARTFAKNLGADLQYFDMEWEWQGLMALSDLFEEASFLDGGPPPTEAEAARAWNKTLKDLGYTEETEINWG